MSPFSYFIVTGRSKDIRYLHLQCTRVLRSRVQFRYNAIQYSTIHYSTKQQGRLLVVDSWEFTEDTKFSLPRNMGHATVLGCITRYKPNPLFTPEGYIQLPCAFLIDQTSLKGPLNLFVVVGISQNLTKCS